MDNAIILDERPLRVTTTQFETGVQTYALNDIKSARMESNVPSLLPVALLSVIAITLCWFGVFGFVLGVLVGFGAFWIWASRVSKFSVVLSNGTTDIYAYSGINSQEISRIAAALNEAIAQRMAWK